MEDLKLIEKVKRVDAAGGAGLEELPHQVLDEKSQVMISIALCELTFYAGKFVKCLIQKLMIG